MQEKTWGLGFTFENNNLVEKKKDKGKTVVVFPVRVGAAERTRTFDLLINSQSHYRAMQRRQTVCSSASFSFIKLFKFSHFKKIILFAALYVSLSPRNLCRIPS